MERQHSPERLRRILEQFRNRLLIETVRLHAVIRKPSLHLLYGVGIVKIGKFLHKPSQFAARTGIRFDGVSNERHIQSHAAVVDFLVVGVLAPNAVRHRELTEFLLNGQFRFNITEVVCLECFPFIGSVFGQIPCSMSIGGSGFAGRAEIADEVFALGQFLLL